MIDDKAVSATLHQQQHILDYFVSRISVFLAFRHLLATNVDPRSFTFLLH